MNTFYLVRHAHADYTRNENRPLSARGREDAHHVAELLQTYPIDRILSSPYRRAHETIAPLAGRLGLAIHTEPDLRERQLGHIPSGGFLSAVEATWQDPSFNHPGGESNAAAQQRGLAVIRRLQEKHTAEHIVLSTHGNLMALLLQGFDPSVDFAFWKALTMPDVYTLRFTQAGEAVVNRLWQ
jgi:2,3-bisphosphoglycerate-dependent phosphoglycerate mutase